VRAGTDGSQARESFRDLLLRHRGRAGLTQRQLAARAGVSPRSVQDWEAGVKFPTAERLQTLIQAVLESGGLTPGRETSDARELWMAAERQASRVHPPFDEEWFARLLVARASISTTQPEMGTQTRAQDWGDAPDTPGFVGRGEELALLQRWVVEEACPLVTVLGFGGIGKTSLTARFARIVAPGFQRVYWQSLRNAPPVMEWFGAVIGFLSDHRVVPPASESEQLAVLLQLLRTRRCLLLLDNYETLFEPGEQLGRYRAGMAGYGQLLDAMGVTSHQSCLVLTSREEPPELAVLGGGVRCLELHGLGVADAQALLADKQLVGDTQAWLGLVDRYGGNGLALKIVGETIRQIRDRDVNAFLTDSIATYGTVFGGIRRLLDAQAERLSPLEFGILTRLAVDREPITLAELAREMPPNVSRGTVVEALEALLRRSLAEPGERRSTFTLQSMVLEYMTDRLVESAADEIVRGQPVVLVEQPLIKAQAKEYVRETEERLIGAPILQRLNDQYTDGGTELQLLELLETWRGRSAEEQGYGPGNAVNLLRLLRGNLRGMDLSRLAIRQAYLAVVEIQEANLVGADLAETVLAEGFSELRSVALSADGALLAAGAATGEVWLWRVADRTALLQLPAHTGVVWSVVFSADGSTLASGGNDGMVRLWDTNTGQLETTLDSGPAGVWDVALSADGCMVASGSGDGNVHVWEAGTGRHLARLPGHAGVVWGVALSADGQLLASGGGDGTLRLWKTSTGRLLGTLRGHSGGIHGVALCADDHVLASCGDDETVRLWDTSTGQEVATLDGHIGVVWGVALSANGEIVASGGEDTTVRLRETRTGRSVVTLHGHTNEIMQVALSADGQLVASCGLDTTVRLWDAKTGRPLAALYGNPTGVSDLALSADRSVLATKGKRGPRLWETTTGRALMTPQGNIDRVWRVALSADGQLLAGGFGDGTVCLWETTTGRQLATLHGHRGAIWSVALSADGRLVASGGGDGTVRIRETRTGAELVKLEGHAGAVWRVALSADGRLLASGGRDGTVRFWDTSTGRQLATLHGHTGGVYGVALTADGQLLASCGDDGTVRLWNATTDGEVATLESRTDMAWTVALSAAGDVVASGGFDGMLRVWEHVREASPSDWRPLNVIQGHIGTVQALALSADGQLLVSSGSDGAVRLWDPRSGNLLRTIQTPGRCDQLDITGLTGVTEAQRATLLGLGAIEMPA
jgi:WD40 repeat protein/transcriptional regulator with XRE-family HTH domain